MVPPTSREQVVPDLLQGEVVVVEPQPALLVPPTVPPVAGEPPVPTVPPELDPPLPTVPPEPVALPPVPVVPPLAPVVPPLAPVVPPLAPPPPADDPHAPRLVRPSKKRPLKRIRAVTVMGSSSSCRACVSAGPGRLFVERRGRKGDDFRFPPAFRGASARTWQHHSPHAARSGGEGGRRDGSQQGHRPGRYEDVRGGRRACRRRGADDREPSVDPQCDRPRCRSDVPDGAVDAGRRRARRTRPCRRRREQRRRGAAPTARLPGHERRRVRVGDADELLPR